MKSLRDMLRYASPEEHEGDKSTDQSEDPTRNTRRWPISRRYMESALQDICEYNDISEEQLVFAPETITSVEMFLYNFPHICCMSFFPNLVSLSLVQQNLLSIEGLHYCPHLELLRLSENSIQRIEGLGNCLKLKELFLHSNRIDCITGISHLLNLEVLWLSNNEIHNVEGLGDLPLKELSLARNPISQLGEVLNMKELEFLNVAATNIGSFKEIGNLTRLKNLKDLRFSDPQWGDSPLALLHNYHTYILFRLRQLQSVDTEDITEEKREAARAMYTRKRVYYNMCIKYLQQNRKNSTNPCLQAGIQRIKCLQKKLSMLVKTRKGMEKEMCEEENIEKSKNTVTENDKIDSGKSKEWWVQSTSKLFMIDHQISNLMKHIDHMRTQLHLLKAKDEAAVDLNIHWLMVELDTGGNVRMEVGNSKNAWFRSCMDLVLSRFFLVDFVPLSITGMRVLKVTRIHNRFLQDRFERRIEVHVEKGNKKHVEYLLYGETLQAPDELQWIIEEGFPFAAIDSDSPHVSTGAVVVSNSIGLADMCRLEAIAEQSTDGSFRGKATGWLLIVKTCLGESVQDITYAYTRNPRAAFIVNGVHQTESGENFAPAKKTSYPHADSVYRTHPVDPAQRSWSVFDAATVVPEYLVEFEYSFKESDTNKLDPVAAFQKSVKLSKPIALINEGHNLEPFVYLSASEVNHGNFQAPGTTPETDDLAPGLLNLNLRSNPVAGESAYCSDRVPQALPLLTELDCKTALITKEDSVAGALSKYSTQMSEGAYGNAETLKADERISGKVEPRSATPTLRQLCDSFRLSPYRLLNQVTKFQTGIEAAASQSFKSLLHSMTKEGDPAACCEGVEEVHLEHRKLRTMSCLDTLPNLRRLFLSGNEISVIAGLDNCTMLEELILDDNAINQVSGISKLQSLWRLDLGCNQLTSCIDVSVFTTIEQLSIENNQIGSLKGLEGLVSLMVLYAQNNQLANLVEINYARNLPKLMVVNFCGNSLCEIRDYRLYTVYSLRKLKVLDGVNVDCAELADARNKFTGRLLKEVVEECVGHNNLAALQVLDLSEQKIRHCGEVFESTEFQNLRELNLNNNRISSLHPLRYLSNLLILRLENNSIENGPLIGSPSLCTSSEESLDFRSIEGERLGNTVNSVASTSSPGGLEALQVLELTGNCITSIMSLQLSSFPMLKHLSLQDNKITKVDGLEKLKRLEQLYLNHNSIRELDPTSFASLQNVRVLHLGDNSLKNLVHLGGLISLESLDLTSNGLTPNRLGGFASIDYLSPLPKLTKLWLNNNPMSRQNQYRISVIGKLEHLEQLDGRSVSEEERQEADAYAAGKEALLDPNLLLESTPNLMTVGGQIKVPLKVTSLNFDSLCTTAKGTTVNYGSRGFYGIQQSSTQNITSCNSQLCNSAQHNLQKQLWTVDQFNETKQTSGKVVRRGGRGENKAFMLPFQTFLKNVSPGKERGGL